jgi:hypothetical protein
METQWYYTDQGQRRGPVSPEQLKQLATSGRIQPSDMVWKQGMAQWAAASEIKGLWPEGVLVPTSESPPPLPTPQQHQPTTGTRVCEWCRELIHIGALKCPHCTKWRKDIQKDINGKINWQVMAITFVIGGAIMGPLAGHTGWWDEGLSRDFSLHKFLSSFSGWWVLFCTVASITSLVQTFRYERSVKRKTGG